tara:strand:- start:4445 stop:4888 length:444 start_codon:yes stop_codon:yes gene_type:complete
MVCDFIFIFITKGYELMKTKLLCTFTDIKDYVTEIDNIKTYYDILFNKIYILQNSDDLDSLLLTYNIDANKANIKNFYKNTISVHRKKDSNSLYTINSLNALIEHLNGGILDRNYSINWDDYKNTLLLTDGTSYKEVKTRLFKIISI